MAAINKSDNVMKANEIPEKIYVTEGMLFMTNPEITLRGNGNKIEYTRTDDFIENAWNWIEDNIFTTIDAVRYITEAKYKKQVDEVDDNGGFREL